ncbi:hypothetical protein Dsin_011559 [Dipteronia sinensis]|uniref:Uncharacterized protein n=1 Tax=Dipteronia sinensis TaxID=43782 RepID=A0AAE0AVW4_9ROSI|nr:hypothetical protein Dsin_011559 [Dipteronia sinensis]
MVRKHQTRVSLGSIEPDLSLSDGALFGGCWPSLFFDGMGWKSVNIYGSRDVEPIRAACRCRCRRSTGKRSDDERRP